MLKAWGNYNYVQATAGTKGFSKQIGIHSNALSTLSSIYAAEKMWQKRINYDDEHDRIIGRKISKCRHTYNIHTIKNTHTYTQMHTNKRETAVGKRDKKRKNARSNWDEEVGIYNLLWFIINEEILWNCNKSEINIKYY